MNDTAEDWGSSPGDHRHRWGYTHPVLLAADILGCDVGEAIREGNPRFMEAATRVQNPLVVPRWVQRGLSAEIEEYRSYTYRNDPPASEVDAWYARREQDPRFHTVWDHRTARRLSTLKSQPLGQDRVIIP